MRTANTEGFRQPRYTAVEGVVVSLHSRRRQVPEVARLALDFLIADALTCHPDLFETDLAMIGDLIGAIRDAEAFLPVVMAEAA